MSDKTLTPRQRELYNYLVCEINQHGRTTSLRQAGSELGISHAAVAQLLGSLEEKGYLRRSGRYSRDIELLGPGMESPQEQSSPKAVPIVGRIAAGLPLYAQEEWDGDVLVDPAFFGGSNLFALRVHGDSMRQVGIMDGDLVICEPRQFARNGEIVVALIEHEEATVKRFFLHKDYIELRPENEDFEPMRYELGQVLIQGKVVGVMRGPHTGFL
ncbi:MAG: transcriptional repressor LexA [Desulfobulbaceae bacterium]|nr:transcriptional repressor LexA [Desulfobulbaceae bacterium]